MATEVVLSRQTSGVVQTGTRLDQPGEQFDFNDLLPNELGDAGWGQVWVETDGNVYHVFEASGIVLAMDINSSERTGKPRARWIGTPTFRIGHSGHYGGEGPSNTSRIQSITAATRENTRPASAETDCMETDLIATVFDRTMERLFGRGWKARAAAEVVGRFQGLGPTRPTNQPRAEPPAL
jgi:hypothetical protein